jgi:hypothetical protein
MAIVTIDGGTAVGEGLLQLLKADEIEPGTEPSYQVCKALYTLHPLGAKMAEAPIRMAQSQPRTVTVQNHPPEVAEEFELVWTQFCCQTHILNLRCLSRVYGMASLVLGCKDAPTDQALDMKKLWELPIFFNVFDPLNMSGSAIMNQVPNTPEFNQVVRVVCNGKNYHRSRFRVVMNEQTIYIDFTPSTFGFTGRSVYQRALYPMKSYIKTMIANDSIAGKIALFIAKLKSPGGVINKVMQGIAAFKRMLLKAATNGEIATIDLTEEIETLDMNNVDTAGTFARDNILKDCATAANMPAKLLQNETMIGGMAEGTEDAKNISKYIDGERLEMKPDYDWFDNIIRYRAWMNPAFFTRIKSLYPEEYENVTHEAAFSEWCRAFKATWPSMLVEPPGEQAKGEAVKFEAMVAVAELLMPQLDPDNKLEVVEWLCDNLSQIKTLLPRELNLDVDKLLAHFEENKDRENKSFEASLQNDNADGGGKPAGRGAQSRNDSLSHFRSALARLPGRPVAAAVQ